nr:unnamed protein product [Digitaria exilis]
MSAQFASEHRAARGAPVGEHDLAELGGAEAGAGVEALLHLRVELVVLEPEVVAGQRLEALEVAHGEVDVDVEPARPQHGRVDAVLAAAHGEHEHALLAAGRGGEPVHEAEHARRPLVRRLPVAAAEVPVEVLDEDERPRGGVEEQRAEVVAAGAAGAGQVDVVDVVSEEPRHRGGERGLAGAGGAVEQVAPAPDAAEAVVVGAALEEGLEVGADAGLELGVHRHGVERGRVGEGRGRPPRRRRAAAGGGVGVQPQLPSARLHLVGDGLDVLQVGSQHAGAVVAADAEDEAVGAGVGPREARAEERSLLLAVDDSTVAASASSSDGSEDTYAAAFRNSGFSAPPSRRGTS